jgi:type IV secretory pathway TrbF-like protein
MSRYPKNNQGFVSLIGMLLTLIIICFLVYTMLNIYFKPGVVEKTAGKNMQASGIDTSSYKSIVDSTKDKVKEINQRSQERVDQLRE